MRLWLLTYCAFPVASEGSINNGRETIDLEKDDFKNVKESSISESQQ